MHVLNARLINQRTNQREGSNCLFEATFTHTYLRHFGTKLRKFRSEKREQIHLKRHIVRLRVVRTLFALLQEVYRCFPIVLKFRVHYVGRKLVDKDGPDDVPDDRKGSVGMQRIERHGKVAAAGNTTEKGHERFVSFFWRLTSDLAKFTML